MHSTGRHHIILTSALPLTSLAESTMRSAFVILALTALAVARPSGAPGDITARATDDNDTIFDWVKANQDKIAKVAAGGPKP
ncbi:hypothetical protein PC9H_010980 [Pleurotus ostreatus]|uniref:Uncharacterized protein n=1 Tax=Pleurotus ostreatus TaxID=5322 RepID=A0A8H6ZNH2_PLEOS|nr:uncharacterized protein PC9H_010980 [Pleurotus ostreatus]KAF7422821.1 hypothetical protein PC9H_010980 [Pleurotus ostreatus]